MRSAACRVWRSLTTHKLGWAVAWAGTCLTASVFAGMPDFTLPSGSTREETLLPFRVNGRPVVLQSFVAPQALAEVAAKLIPQIHGRPVLLGLNDGVLISWSEKSWLWSVRLRGLGADRTQGTVSGSDMAEGATTVPRRLAWMPANASLALDVSTRQAGRQATQQVYLHTVSASRLSSLIRTALTRCGWLPVSESEGAGHWQRNDARLDLVLVPTSGGSGLVLHLAEPVTATRGAAAC